MLRSTTICCTTCIIFCVFTGSLTDLSAQDAAADRPRILVTNDDGIDAPGLRALVKELSEFADVTVCAPSTNRSGASQSVTYFSFALLVHDVPIEGALNSVALDGTPADAAHFGIMHFGKEKPFDLLISGMNHGSNVGDLSHGSGTIGAAMEGAFRRVPSIAVSVDARLRDLAAAAKFACRFARQRLERNVDPDIVYSLNIPVPPDGGWNGIRAVPMGGSYLRATTYQKERESDDGHVYRADVSRERAFPEGSDSQAYQDGFITITPLRFDWTHHEALDELADWDFDSN